MPVYNEDLDHLKNAIQSILGQSYGNIELVIVDDSTDRDVVGYLKGIEDADPRVVYLHNSEKLGMVKSLNLGLSVARGDYIGRADSDDIQEKDRIEKQLNYLNNNPSVDILGSWIQKIDDRSEGLGVRRYPVAFKDVEKSMMIRNAVAHATVLMPKAIFTKIGYYDESFKKAEDYELWMRALKYGLHIANFPEPLTRYRMPGIAKRDITNWKCNMEVKMQYFNTNHLLHRLLGLAAVLLFSLLPFVSRSFIYSLYNRKY
ncbi:MAG: glycosyltransferase [Syntrophales bacterium]|nr:glycosyltransferase [Syntrophales bacterium]